MIDSPVHRRRTTLRLARFVLLSLVSFAWALAAAPGPVAAEVPVVLFGQATDESGAAIEGATVVARAERSVHQRALDELAGEPHRVEAESVTNAQGTYFLRVGPGTYEVEATADGRASRHIHVLPVAESFRLEPVALPPAGMLQVRVRAADGEPVAGTYVAGRSDDGVDEQGQWHERVERVRTDEAGAATLPIDRGAQVDLRVVADDGSFFYRDGVKGGFADVILEQGTEWTVRVEDPRGRAMSGVLVHLSQMRIPAARTGDDGTFRVRLPQQPSVTLRLTHEDGHYHRTSVGDDPDDETKRRVFTLADPVAVSGRVVDTLSGEGIAGALVWPSSFRYDATVTDRSGGFQLPPRIQSAWIRAAARGYSEGFLDLHRQQEPAEPVIRLSPATRLTGRVVGPAGQGLAGVEIVAVVKSRPGLPGWPHRDRAERVRSGEDGSFTFERLLPESVYELEATRAGYARAVQRATTLRPPEVAEVGLTLEPGVQAVGRIVNEADRPLAGATVELRPPTADPTRMGRQYYRQTSQVLSGASGEDGEFLVADVARGTYRIVVQSPGFARTVVPGVEISDDLVFEVADESGERRLQADLGVIVLVPGVALEGLVVDSDDRPVEGAQVELTAESDQMAFQGPRRTERSLQTTDAEGRFRFADLTPGERLDLRVRHESFGGLRLPGVQPPTDEPLRIVLERTAVVRGRVVNETFAPVHDVTVHTRPEGPGANLRFPSGQAYDKTDATGAFEVKHVPPGTLKLVVGEDAWKVEESPRLEIEPGEVVEGVELRVSRSLVLEGTVRGPDGQPAAHAKISMTRKVGSHGSSRNTRPADSEGRFEFGGVEEGEVTVSAQHPNLGFAEKTLQIAAPGARVDLVLEGGGEVMGRVLGPDGAPATSATVTLQLDFDAVTERSVSHRSSSELVDGDGRFRFAAVAEGRYILRVDHPDYAQHRSDGFEVADSVIERRIELSRGAVVTGRLEGLDFEQLGAVEVWTHGTTGARRKAVVRHDATYRMTGLGEGPWSFQAQAGDQTRSGRLVIEPGQTEASLDFDFGGGFELEGRIRRDGESLAGVQVIVNHLEDPRQHSRAQADFEGRFRLSGLEEGRYQLQVYSYDGFRHHRQIDVPYPGTLDIDVRTSKVEGVVRSVDGAPLAGARLVAKRVADVDLTDTASLYSSFADQQSATADASGVYRFDHLPEGPWTLTASHDGFARAEAVAELVQGSDLLGFDFALEPVPGLWLDLVAAPGMNLPRRVAVAVLSPSGQQHSVLDVEIGESGAVHLASLPAGTWRLAVGVSGAATAHLAVRAPDDRPTVVLAPEAKLKISSPELDDVPGIQQATVTRADGFVHKPLFAGYMLPGWPLVTDHREVHGLSAGTWTVDVTLPDGRVLRGTATVQTGETVELELD